MIRVLHLINALNPGGIETWLLRMLTEIPRRHVAMDFACKGTETGVLADDARLSGASVHHLPLRISHLEFVGGLLKLLRSGKYDLVHNHLDVTGGPAVWAAGKAGVPVVSSFHNTHFPPQTWTRLPGFRQLRSFYARVSLHYSLQQSTMITGCSQAVLNSLLPRSERNERHAVQYYGVESHSRATEVQRRELRAELGLGPQTPLVLHVGRFFPQKNHAGLLRIFQRVTQRCPDARLLLIGDGALRTEIETQIHEMRLDDAVRLVGIRRDVPRWMTAADVMLLPSLHEGLPVVSLEAAACELPLVGSDIPGTNESVIDGQTGFLHEVLDEPRIAESVVQLLKNPSQAQKMGLAAKALVEAHFSLAASATSLLQLYQDALTISGKPHQPFMTARTKKAGRAA